MHILVFGETGQVSTELRKHKDASIRITSLNRQAADLTNPQACANAIVEIAPDAVINAAAFTAVDWAETAQTAARKINAEAPAAMARACFDCTIPFVHISTDYVFSGVGSAPWRTNDKPDPQSIYGRTKRDGEISVAAVGGAYAILRTSWVFSAHGKNFVKTMLDLGRKHSELDIVSDQVGGPTAASDIAQACITMIKALKITPDKRGTYHLSGAPDISWSNFARAIFEAADVKCHVHDIPTSAYQTAAKRPLNSRLNCTSTFETFGIQRPDWLREVTNLINELST